MTDDLRPAAEVARELNLVDYVLTFHEHSADGVSCTCTGGFSELGVLAVAQALTARDQAVAERVLKPFLDLQVCSRCGEVSPEHTGSLDPSWHCGGDYWEHKCPDMHSQVGHLPTVAIRALDPAKILEVEE